jgi:hypothetical protein
LQQPSAEILKSLSVPSKPWTSIFMHLITGQSWSEGHDDIWVMVDQLMKMQHFVPYQTTTSTSDLADMI